MINTVPVARRNRGGTGLLPPNSTQWDCEHNGLDVRRELGVPLEARLDIPNVFGLLPRVVVKPHGEVAMAAVLAEYFRGEASGRWSGLALPLGDGSNLIIYNDSHPETRVRATLMEEFFHLRLDHPRSQIRLLSDGSRERTVDSEVERIAYGSGAAALVPFAELKALVMKGVSVSKIGQQLGVSEQLVTFRLKVTRLYRRRRAK